MDYETEKAPEVRRGCRAIEREISGCIIVWSLNLTERHKLRVFENGMLRRTFGPMMEEVTGGQRRLNNEELHNFCPSPNKIRTTQSRGDKMRGTCSILGTREKFVLYFLSKKT
jgi:hypothetical protein